MNLDPKSLIDEPVVIATAVPDAEATPSPTIEISDEFVAHLNGMTPEPVTPEIIRAVIAAQNLANSGDPLGTIRRSDSGAVATRVCRGGVPQWAVVQPDGGFGYDTEPTLKWARIAGPN